MCVPNITKAGESPVSEFGDTVMVVKNNMQIGKLVQNHSMDDFSRKKKSLFYVTEKQGLQPNIGKIKPPHCAPTLTPETHIQMTV